MRTTFTKARCIQIRSGKWCNYLIIYWDAPRCDNHSDSNFCLKNDSCLSQLWWHISLSKAVAIFTRHQFSLWGKSTDVFVISVYLWTYKLYRDCFSHHKPSVLVSCKDKVSGPLLHFQMSSCFCHTPPSTCFLLMHVRIQMNYFSR